MLSSAILDSDTSSTATLLPYEIAVLENLAESSRSPRYFWQFYKYWEFKYTTTFLYCHLSSKEV